MDFLRSNSYVEGIAAFGTIAFVLSRYARQTDIGFTMRTFAVNVGFAVFPFVSAQEEPLLRFSHTEKIFSVFLRSLGGLSGKHTVEHEEADGKRNAVQNQACGRAFDEYRK